MPSTSFADFTAECDSLLATVEANAENLSYLGEMKTELTTNLQGAREASLRQAAFRAQFQQATRDLEGFVARGRDLATRLRNGIRSRYGLRDEKLTEFGLRPRRKRRSQSKKKPPEPVPSPGTPTAASKTASAAEE